MPKFQLTWPAKLILTLLFHLFLTPRLLSTQTIITTLQFLTPEAFGDRTQHHKARVLFSLLAKIWSLIDPERTRCLLRPQRRPACLTSAA